MVNRSEPSRQRDRERATFPAARIRCASYRLLTTLILAGLAVSGLLLSVILLNVWASGGLLEGLGS